jgi:hypothetical protein
VPQNSPTPPLSLQFHGTGSTQYSSDASDQAGYRCGRGLLPGVSTEKISLQQRQQWQWGCGLRARRTASTYQLYSRDSRDHMRCRWRRASTSYVVGTGRKSKPLQQRQQCPYRMQLKGMEAPLFSNHHSEKFYISIRPTRRAT